MMVEQKKSYNVIRDHTSVASSANPESYIREYFIPRNLNHIGAEQLLSPKITEQLVELTLERRLLIIASRPDLRADHLLPYIAWGLRNTIQRKEGQQKNVPFLECTIQQDLIKLDLVIELAQMDPAIVMIPSALPQYLGWNLARLQRTLISTQSFIICSTNIPEQKWYLSSNDVHFLHNLPEKLLYDSTFLTDSLVKQLIQYQKSLPKNLQGIIDPEQIIFPNSTSPLTFRDVAKKLETDTNISIFIQKLCSLTSITETEIKELILLSQQCKSEAIKEWFFSLSPQEQLLALGVSFFDGLNEEQVFSALQELIRDIWQQNSTLEIFDYLELEKISRFFPIINVNTEHPRFQGILPNQRQIILRLGWDRYRVHICTALPWLVQIVKASIEHDASQYKLYSDKKRRDQLRNIISETISDVGFISINHIQDTLLWLVADNEYPIQVVAARILANLYHRGERERFFNILHSWQNNKRSLIFLEEALKQQYEPNKYNIQECVDSAIILAISYVSKYIPSNKIPTNMINILNKMIKNPHKRILHTVNNYTIPMLLSSHLRQMTVTIQIMLLNPEFHQSLSNIFINTYKRKDVNILSILNTLTEKYLLEPKLKSFNSDEKVIG